jgi:hypothetical protein
LERLESASCYLNLPGCRRPIQLFSFSVARRGQTPVELLGESKGALLADGYGGHNSDDARKRRRAARDLCARKKLIEFSGSFKKEAKAVRSFYTRIYEVEHRAKEEEIGESERLLKLWQTISSLFIEEFKEFLETTKKLYLPLSSLL